MCIFTDLQDTKKARRKFYRTRCVMSKPPLYFIHLYRQCEHDFQIVLNFLFFLIIFNFLVNWRKVSERDRKRRVVGTADRVQCTRLSSGSWRDTRENRSSLTVTRLWTPALFVLTATSRRISYKLHIYDSTLGTNKCPSKRRLLRFPYLRIYTCLSRG